jgi:alpha-amylase
MITLVLAFHNHQPVGNFGWVFEEAYTRAYRPLMELLGRYPSIRFAQHYTGILLDWFEKNHPDFLQAIGRSVAGEQVELLSGGYYEPILAMLPERDRQAQISRLNRRIAESFGVTPTGMWLAERVWEPSLPSTLHAAGIRYTFLDDTHFKSAGLAESELTGYFLTEDQGKPLAVFPIDKKLRYTMPFEEPEATFAYLKKLDVEGEDRIVTFADDGEKFGIWPETYTTVYDQKWLERFCELLVEHRDWVRTELPSRVIAGRKPAGRIYLPTASYAEMLHWALPTVKAYTDYETFEKVLKEEGILERFEEFVRGGFWRNFMVKYPEVNAMQKKMLRTSGRIARIREALAATPGASPEPEEITSAYDHLMAGQCNCPYWHGVFGGIYLANIRMAMYRELIAAERDLDRYEGLEATLVSIEDYDLDGAEEILAEGPAASIYLSPERGAGIFEFDYKPVGYNFCDVLQRRKEGYHAQLARAPKPSADGGSGAKSIHEIVRVKEPGLLKAIAYDPYRHATLLDHFYGSDLDATSLREATVAERGDFHTGTYDHAVTREPHGGVVITLERRGTVDRRQPVSIRKVIRLDLVTAELRADYLVSSLDGSPMTGRFGIEMTYSLSAGTEPDRYYTIDGRKPPEREGRLDGAGEAVGRSLSLTDEWLGIRLAVELERPALLVRTPLETVSLSEEGFERNYQGSLIVAAWELEGARQWRMTLTQKIEQVKPLQ